MILDTNAISAAADGEANALDVMKKADQLFLPAVALGEYRFGIAQSRYKASYEKWLKELSADVNVLDIDERTAHFYAAICLELKKEGKPIPTNDLWIAALCRQHSLPLLSLDQHFDLVSGLRRVGW